MFKRIKEMAVNWIRSQGWSKENLPSALKNKLPQKCKRLLFFTSSQRQQEKQEVKEK